MMHFPRAVFLARTVLPRLPLYLTPIVLAACGTEQAESGLDAPPAVQTGGTVVVAEAADMDQPMPLLGGTALDAALADVLYLPLLREVWEDGALRHVTGSTDPMALARTVSVEGPDSTTLRFQLRSGLHWSDGVPITAADVAWTYRMLANPLLASPRQDFTAQIDSVVAENDSTVVFHFARRYPEMLAHASHPVAPAHVYRGIGPAEIRGHASLTDPANKLVVSGPFRIGGWEKGRQITLVPNERFEPRPHLDRVVIRVIPEPTTRLVEFRTGNVDFLSAVALDQTAELQASVPGMRLEKEEKRFYDYLAYNPKAHPAFADADIRRALGLAVDVPRLIRALGIEAYAVPAGGPYPPILREVYDAGRLKPLPYDTARARQILDSKGWQDTDGDGVRDKNNRPFRFTLTTNAGNTRREAAAQIIQQQWRAIGVDARLDRMEWNALAGRMLERDYEAVLAGWGVELSPRLVGVWSKDTPFNITGYESARVSGLFDRALAQPTAAQAAPLWREAAVELVRDQPYTWLYFYDTVDAVSPRLRGTNINVLGPYRNLRQWHVTPAEAANATQPQQTAAAAR